MELNENGLYVPPGVAAGEPTLLHQRGVESLTVIHNPGPAYRQAAEAFLQQMTEMRSQHQLELLTLPTLPSFNETFRAMEDTQRPNNAYIVIGGDGTINTGMEGARRLGGYVAVMAAGRTNDVGRYVNTNDTLQAPHKLFTEPTVIRDVHPLDVNVTPIDTATDEPLTDEAIAHEVYAYFSTGLSAVVAEKVNDADYRALLIHKLAGPIGSRLVDKMMTAYKSVVTPRFRLHHDSRHHDKAMEILVANTGLMAGQLRPHADIFTPKARVLRSHHRLSAYALTFAMLLGLPVGEDLGDGISFVADAKGGLRYQKNGDHRVVTGKALFEITMSPYAVGVVTPPGKLGARKRKFKPSNVVALTRATTPLDTAA